MITRVLDKSEWHKLSEESGLPKLLPYVNPDMVDVIAVEDDGRIVACWAVMRMTHLEGIWIDPEYRSKPGVLLRLLRKVKQITGSRELVMTAAERGETLVHGLIERFGGIQLPIDAYSFPASKVN